MAGELKRRPADAALVWAALLAVLLPSIFLVGPLAWWVWEQNWTGTVWLSRFLAVAAALVLPAALVCAAWFGVRWYIRRGAAQAPESAPGAAPVMPARPVNPASPVHPARPTNPMTGASATDDTIIIDPLVLEWFEPEPSGS